MAYREALPEQPNKTMLIQELDRVEEFNESIRTVVPADHFLEEEHQQCNQQSQVPLECAHSPPPRPMTPPPIPFV